MNRPYIIEQIKNRLKSQKEGIQTVFLTGMGGVGKSILARQYASSCSAFIIGEIDAKNNQTTLNSFENLAYALAQTDQEKKIFQSIQDLRNLQEKDSKIMLFVQEKLRSHPHWLLIYDNLEHFNEIQPYFPKNKDVWGQGQVIITTKNFHHQQAIQIEELSDQEKFLLFTKIIANKEHMSQNFQNMKIKNFLKHIPSFPLDIVAAAHYLKSTNAPLDKYLNYIRHYDPNFNFVQNKILKDVNANSNTRYNIVTLSLEKVIHNQSDFIQPLMLLSILDAQNISRDLLISCKNNFIIDDFIYNLKKYSLISPQSADNAYLMTMFKMHQSVQAVCLIYLNNKVRLQERHFSWTPVIKTFVDYIATTIEDEEYLKMPSLILHCDKILKQHQFLSKNDQYLVQSGQGILYFYLGEYQKARKILEDVFHNIKNNSEISSDHKAWIQVYLGELYRNLGEFDQAKDLLNQGLTYYQKNISQNRLKIAQTSKFLATLYRDIESHLKAKEFYEKSLQLYQTYFPHKKARIIGIMTYLASLYSILGDYSNACNLLEKSLSVHVTYFPDDEINLAWIETYLGSVYKDLGRYQKSQETLDHVLQIYKKYFPDELDVGWVLTHLGILSKNLGDYPKAEKYFEESLIIHQRILGHNNIKNIWIQVHLGDVYRYTNKQIKAKKILETCYHNYCTYFTKDHFRVAWSSLYLGNMYRDLGYYQQSKDLLNKSLIFYEQYYGKNHIKYGQVLLSLGQTVLFSKNFDEAEMMINRALKIFILNHHPHRYKCYETLADIYQQKWQLDLDFKIRKEYEDKIETYLNQASLIVETNFPSSSLHVKRIRSKKKKNYVQRVEPSFIFQK